MRNGIVNLLVYGVLGMAVGSGIGGFLGMMKAEQTLEQDLERQTIKATVTAYCPCEKCCGRFADGVTASGHKIEIGDKLAASAWPIGTEVIIDGYNDNEPVKVLDRIGDGDKNHIDLLFFEISPAPLKETDLEYSHQLALEWGRKEMSIWIKE